MPERRLEGGPVGHEPDPSRRAGDDETSPVRRWRPLSAFDAGFLVGILVGEGHFGGDGRQAQVTLRMHTDHEALFHWLVDRVPGSRLYGPYHHGGRDYYQWMARGAVLRDTLVPLLETHLSPAYDERAWRRFQQMRADYRL